MEDLVREIDALRADLDDSDIARAESDSVLADAINQLAAKVEQVAVHAPTLGGEEARNLSNSLRRIREQIAKLIIDKSEPLETLEEFTITSRVRAKSYEQARAFAETFNVESFTIKKGH